MMRRILKLITSRMNNPRVIYDRMGLTPYLSRYYIAHKPQMPGGSDPFERDGSPRKGAVWSKHNWNLFLHRFHRGDDDLELHNHPWRWAVALVLAGGYIEERRIGDKVVTRRILPGRINFIRGGDYHRVELIEYDAWTLFLAGPKASTWYFWNRHTRVTTQWRAFIDAKRAEALNAKHNSSVIS